MQARDSVTLAAGKDDPATAHLRAERLEGLAQLTLLGVAAQHVEFEVPEVASLAAGPRSLRLAFASMGIRISFVEAFGATSETRLLPREAQVRLGKQDLGAMPGVSDK